MKSRINTLVGEALGMSLVVFLHPVYLLWHEFLFPNSRLIAFVYKSVKLFALICLQPRVPLSMQILNGSQVNTVD